MLSRTIYTYIVNYIEQLLQFKITIKQCDAVTYSFFLYFVDSFHFHLLKLLLRWLII